VQSEAQDGVLVLQLAALRDACHGALQIAGRGDAGSCRRRLGACVLGEEERADAVAPFRRPYGRRCG
jgi:hypothetical protein